MTSNKTNENNVLPFRRVAQAESRLQALAAELGELLGIYERLIALLRETDDEGLDTLTDELVMAVVRCRETLADGMEETPAQEMVKEMRGELRQMPRTLRSLLPGIGPRLGESIEHKLGIHFSAYQ